MTTIRNKKFTQNLIRKKFLCLEYLITENGKMECDTFGIMCGSMYPAGILLYVQF